MTPVRLMTLLVASLSGAVASAQPSGPRVAATTLKMPAEGNRYAYKTMPAFGGIFFDQPVQVVFAPGETQRAFVVERAGRVAVVRDTTNPKREIFLDISSRIGTATSDHGLLTIAFHPHFA